NQILLGARFVCPLALDLKLRAHFGAVIFTILWTTKCPITEGQLVANLPVKGLALKSCTEPNIIDDIILPVKVVNEETLLFSCENAHQLGTILAITSRLGISVVQ